MQDLVECSNVPRRREPKSLSTGATLPTHRPSGAPRCRDGGFCRGNVTAPGPRRAIL